MSSLAVALTGNPNTGKSTIFNELTGARQKIGNWPGVTVDKKIGYLSHQGRNISVVDLPGTYSVNARSPEEKIVIEYPDGAAARYNCVLHKQTYSCLQRLV